MKEDEPKDGVTTPFKVVAMRQEDQGIAHVDTFRGKKVYMDIVPMETCDFQVSFIIMCKHTTIMGEEAEHSRVLCAYYMKRRWWHRMLRISDEALIDTAVRCAKLRWKRVKENTQEFERVREKYGLSNDHTFE